MDDAYNSMDLETAYEIAGGYKEADDEVFAKALELVKADDENFARELQKARDAEHSLMKKQEKEESISASDEDVSNNASFIKKEFDNNELKKNFFADEEVQEAEANTPIYDVDPVSQERFELEGDERHAHFEMLFEKAKLDVWREQTGNDEFARQSNEEKKETLFSEIKNSFLATVAQLRTSAQIENEVPEAAQAIEKQDKSFFAKQAGSMLGKISNAFNLKKKIKVSSSAVMAACAESEAKTEEFAKKLTKLAQKANGKKKEYFSKAAVLTHQVKSVFAEKAKQAWGQRYEFIANVKDRAPKITTNLVATGVLVGAAASSASWLGAAVIGYGAYKATSAWVWPIVTHARKEARLAKKDKNAPKVSFFKRLKDAPKTIFANKELRESYFKEAGWGSAAALVGLGAAGTVAGIGGGVLVQKSAQSLSSAAVYTANSITSAARTLKDKTKDIWTKGLAVASTAVMSYVLISCGENTGNQVSMDAGLAENSDSASVGEVVQSDTIKAASNDSIQSQTSVIENSDDTSSAVVGVATEVNVPEEWDESMYCSSRQWNDMHSYFGDKFDVFYGKISDDMLQDGGAFAGKTREQVLFEYKQLGSWNLPQHREALAKLDEFFECDKTLSAEDVQAMNDVLQNGGIKDVEGTACLRVVSRDTGCGEDPVLHTQTVDCGCNDANEEIPEQVSQGSVQTQTEQTEFDDTSSISVTTVTQTQTEVTSPKLETFKGNGISPDKITVTGDASLSDVTSLDLKNASNVLIEEGEGNEDGVSSLSATTATVNNATLNTNVTDGSDGFVDTSSFGDAVSSSASEEGFEEHESFVSDHSGGAATVAAQTDTNVENGEMTEVSDLNAERGGYNNTGLTVQQYKKLESFFEIKGADAFEFYKGKITDDMLAKGGIFEGLTREQALFTYKQIVEWSDNKVGAFRSEIVALDRYFNGCDETIDASKTTDIKELVDRVNSDGTIDGVRGDKCVQTVHYTFNDCDQSNVYTRVDADCGTTNPSGKKWPRMFTQLWNKAPEPETFVDSAELKINEVIQAKTQVVDPTVVEFKGNNLEDIVPTKPATIESVEGLNTQNQEGILVESGVHTDTTQDVVTEGSSRATKKAAKKAAKQAQEYATWAKARGLSGNPALDKYISNKQNS